ncbi:NfeD family protein [Gallalistipes aquisgranensis]|uniref:NfeD family protein n=1 Tax=Gallalistipes aquisgranensis TaxID=2779358 RepID=UPI001CF8194A|nr:NfeD family protein [Gallalistipes aquisgranensis]
MSVEDTMWVIAGLIAVALLLLVAELVLLPGFSVAGVCALLADIGAIWIAFSRYGVRGGVIAFVVILVLSVVTLVLSLRSRTWQRFSLQDRVDGAAQCTPQQRNVQVGDRGKTLTRLAPIGKISVNGQTFEAKSIDRYVDAGAVVEVTGFENFSVIVQPVVE